MWQFGRSGKNVKDENVQEYAVDLAMTPEIAEQTALLLTNSMRALAAQTEQMAADLQAFNTRKKEAQERIERGGYRTSSRII